MAATTQRLTRATAQKIVNAVTSDKACTDAIDSAFAVLPPSWGVSGGARNLYFMIKSGGILTGAAPSEEETRQVCYGIALATSAAIKRIKIDGVTGAGLVDRDLRGVAHVATQIDLSRYGAVVFDWHATLRSNNPIMYRTVPDFQNGRSPVVFSDFRGF